MGSIITDINDIINLEKSITAQLEWLKSNIVQEIENTPVPGVNHNAPNMFTIRFSQLQNNVWSAEYYLPNMQARHVQQAMSGIATVSAFLQKLREIIEKKSVRISGNTYPLNNTTLCILQKYVPAEN